MIRVTITCSRCPRCNGEMRVLHLINDGYMASAQCLACDYLEPLVPVDFAPAEDNIQHLYLSSSLGGCH